MKGGNLLLGPEAYVFFLDVADQITPSPLYLIVTHIVKVGLCRVR